MGEEYLAMEQAHADAQEIRSAQDTQTRWVVGVISAGLITVLSFFLLQSFMDVQSRLHEHQIRIEALELQLTAATENQKATAATLSRMELTDARLEAKLDRLLEHQRLR